MEEDYDGFRANLGYNIDPLSNHKNGAERQLHYKTVRLCFQKSGVFKETKTVHYD